MSRAQEQGALVDLATAGALLDFGARMGQGPRAEEQLQGAVAIHNILQRHRVAYLADEVGMGKTYVALGTAALFRHFNPRFRTLVIAPRENIQQKWKKELGNFAAYNVRFPDFRNSTITRTPARAGVECRTLMHLVHEAAVNADRDFFVRLSSFSLGLSDKADGVAWRERRDDLLRVIPWLDPGLLSTRSRKQDFKDNLARAICCALPVFDLVIVDEGHNLKHGFRASVAARNRVLALAFGHPSERGIRKDFPNFAPRARRVLLLSATPLEESYRQLWNQLDIFGMGEPFRELAAPDVSEDRKKEVAGQFLVRRVTAISMAGEVYTKNQYRREWRSGGLDTHDQPLAVADLRQRLTVALVQKKVAELLGSGPFKMSFQVGMLASFESFLETAKLKRRDDELDSNFDDPEQTDKPHEREGLDVRDLNRLTRDYRRTFDSEMPHPKMDSLVDALASCWQEGRKALVFVRRVASVKEIKRKLDDRYDEWLLAHLRQRLPDEVRGRFEQLVREYQGLRRAAGEQREGTNPDPAGRGGATARSAEDRGGLDTFYAWFFRGEGPRGVVSGANLQRRFTQAGSALATLFEDNHVAALLDAPPGQVSRRLADHLTMDRNALALQLRAKAAGYLSKAKRHPRGARIEAFQAAATELLMGGKDAIAAAARIVWHQRFQSSKKVNAASTAPEIGSELEFRSVFTELRRPEWSPLREAIWPTPAGADATEQVRERLLRGEAMASVTRLGHSLIDMYILTIERLRSLELRTLEREPEDDEVAAPRAVLDFLRHLDNQRLQSVRERGWGAYDELAALATDFHLILDTNLPDARTMALSEAARHLGAMLGRQQPTAGMSGQINKTVIQQFRMPGYPFVLVTTDLLQEGEDLHTFCSAVYHYGISWTPSAMEQRIGRIDRVRSQTDRRLNGLERKATGEELLQVFYPYLEDTVEILQVHRVLRRMNTFLRLMHEGLTAPEGGQGSIQVAEEVARGIRAVEAITTRLTTAFPIHPATLIAPRRELVVGEAHAEAARRRFAAFAHLPGHPRLIEWESQVEPNRLLGSLSMSSGRVQPFALLLDSDEEHLLVRCISPVGLVTRGEWEQEIRRVAAGFTARVGLTPSKGATEYNVTVEDDVRLVAEAYDVARVSMLVTRVTSCADAIEAAWFRGRDHHLREFVRTLSQEGAHDA